MDQVLQVISTSGLAIYQSSIMDQIETNHRESAYGSFPTLWPVCNSAFLSLDRDSDGVAPLSSFMSCIERQAKARDITLETELLPNVAMSLFGTMHVLMMRAKRDL
jgi:hypothetical protein